MKQNIETKGVCVVCKQIIIMIVANSCIIVIAVIVVAGQVALLCAIG